MAAPKQYLVVGLDGVMAKTGDHGEVFLQIVGLGNELKLAEGIEIILHLTPDESDRLAELLQRMARVARAQSAKKKSTPDSDG